MESLPVSSEVLRRFLVQRLAVNEFQSIDSVVAALDLLQYVQMDSINVCGRMHDLILWPRVVHYKPEDLYSVLYDEPRAAFEHYFPNLSVLRLSDYRYFVPKMRKSEESYALTPEEALLAEDLLAMSRLEPIRTRSLDPEHGHTTGPWGTRTTVAARAVNKLWYHGHLHIHRREGFEKWFSHIESLAPELAALRHDPPSPEETKRHLLWLRTRAHRLFRLKERELDVIGRENLVKVEIPTIKRAWYILREDLPRLGAAEKEEDSEVAMILAPLDPVVYLRERLEDLFQFGYRWEVYTPVVKRRWGYYVMPILWRSQLVGCLDPKFDAPTKTLHILSLQLEPGTDEVALADPLAERIRAYQSFLGATKLKWGSVTPKSFKALLKARCGGR